MDCTSNAVVLYPFRFDQQTVSDVCDFVNAKTGKIYKDLCEVIETLHCNLSYKFAVDTARNTGVADFTITDSKSVAFQGRVTWNNGSCFDNLRRQLARVCEILVAYNFIDRAIEIKCSIAEAKESNHSAPGQHLPGKYGYSYCKCGKEKINCDPADRFRDYEFESKNILFGKGWSIGDPFQKSEQQCWQRERKQPKPSPKARPAEMKDQLLQILSRQGHLHVPPQDIPTDQRYLLSLISSE
nr:MAG: hypothetical protein [Wufeng shrew picorna-like virus 8]